MTRSAQNNLSSINSMEMGCAGGSRIFAGTTSANISTGVDGIDCHSGFPDFLEKQCRFLLGTFGLQDAGCRRDYKDATLPFLKDGFDSGYDFGVVGCLALFVSSCVFFRLQRRDVGLGIECGGIPGHAPGLFFHRLDALERALFLSQLYALRPRSGAAGVL